MNTVDPNNWPELPQVGKFYWFSYSTEIKWVSVTRHPRQPPPPKTDLVFVIGYREVILGETILLKADTIVDEQRTEYLLYSRKPEYIHQETQFQEFTDEHGD